jgi:hypothetical protein
MTTMLLKLSLVSLILFGAQLSHGQKKTPPLADSLAMDVTYAEGTLRVAARYFYNQSKNLTDSVYFTLNPAFRIDKITSPGLLSHKMTMKKADRSLS